MRTAEMAAIPEETSLAPVPPPPRLGLVATAGLVAAGGAVGSLARYLVSLALPAVLTSTVIAIPWGTLLVNLLGCLLIGALYVTLEERPTAPPWIRPALGVGFLGGFTTFSTLILEGAAMMGANDPAMAFAYASITAVGAIGGVVLGFFGTRVVLRRRSGRSARMTGRMSASVRSGR